MLGRFLISKTGVNFSKKTSKKIFFFLNRLVSNKSFFFKNKKQFFLEFFFKNVFFFQIKRFSKKKKNKKKKRLKQNVYRDYIFEAFHLTLWRLSRRIVRIESAGKESMKERHLCITYKLRMNTFCRQWAGLEVLMKVTSKAYRWKENEKSFTQNSFLIAFFSIMSFLSELLTPPTADRKNLLSTWRLYINDVFSSILLQPITAWDHSIMIHQMSYTTKFKKLFIFT